MTDVLTSAQMRAIEAAAIASGKVTGLELMERAGKGVVEAIFEEWPELALPAEDRTGALPRAPGYLGQDEGRRAVVLCGPGNNGGDGFVVARLLKELGWEVEVFLYGDPERMPPDARVNYERWLGMGEVTALSDIKGSLIESLNLFHQRMSEVHVNVVIDSCFGTGLQRPLPHLLDDIATDFFDTRFGTLGRAFFLVAIDLPSGLCADSGRVLGESVYLRKDGSWVGSADLTVTFHRPKLGHMIGGGSQYCGKLVVKDIGLVCRPDPQAGSEVRQEVVHLTDDRVAKEVATKSNGHKYSHGHTLVLSGPTGRGGAARLAARGALRIGAGVVTLGCPPEALAENAARLDAIMLREVADAGALAVVLEDKRINALCLGPGLGAGPREAGLVAAALAEARPIVLDADALTILARDPELIAALHDQCVLTPHAGEFARLFPDLAERLAEPAVTGSAYSKADACRAAAARAGCVVLFKGPDTVIADPSGRCALNSAQYDRAAPWLATAGSGDVLAGFITGLMARGISPFDAACTGAWLHVECALQFGPGLIAEDLPEQLPAVFRRVLK